MPLPPVAAELHRSRRCPTARGSPAIRSPGDTLTATLTSARRRSWAEPYKIKLVELLKTTTLEERQRGIVSAGRDARSGQNHQPRLELVRLTIPRRVYSQAPMDVVAESVIDVAEQAPSIKRLRFSCEPKELRFFLGRFEPVG